ncbi:MAG: hypothetical protein C3F07_16620 [Anaerolineales bacterium]|nr:MAG: hypothetical protein C3F07_16620 [Anaerolineales bacterium]
MKKVSFMAEKSAAKIIVGFPVSEQVVARIGGLKLAAIAHWYFGPVKHDPRTEPMPKEYEAEFAKLWAEV